MKTNFKHQVPGYKMKHSKREMAIALAGVFQAAKLVKQIATTGMANNAIIESSIESLFKFDANSVEDVYGGIAGIGSGIKTLDQQFETNNKSRDIDITKYVISLLILERKLSSNKIMLEHLHSALDEIKTSLEFFGLIHENIFSRLGDLYKNTVSTLGPKIIITSDQPHLTNQQNADKVRSLLLAGIRAAVLWRQCGGTRWHIIFSRKSYIRECEIIKSEL